jgi:hypothetical protein
MAIQITGFRDRIKLLSPSWMQDGTNEREAYVYGLACDAITDKLFQGARARFPTQAPTTALDEIGRDRLILRGLTESDESYGARLQRAFDSHQFSGAARAVLSQLLGFLLAKTPAVRFVSSRYDRSTYPPTRLDSSWDEYPVGRDPNAEPVHTYVTAAGGNLDWDSASEVSGSWSWWGSFVILEAVAPNNWANPATWAIGDTTLTIGTLPGSTGLDVSSNVITSARGITKQFKGAHTWVRWIIISFDSGLFDPASPAGGGINPDGYFGRWERVVAGTYVPSRFSDARYCDGVY